MLIHTAGRMLAQNSFSSARRPCIAPRRAGATTVRRVPAGATRPSIVAMTTLSGGIKLESSPTEAQLEDLGVKSWPTWGCEASKFPWSYDTAETAYVLKGRVVVTPTGGEAVEVKAGDLVTFPAGMSCVWDVKEAIQKHYNFH